jgi:transcriptional regulator of acetoin/glycerol metabolism
VRELQNVIERACALAEGDRITRRDLPDHVLSEGRRGALASSHSIGASHAGEPLTTGADLPLKEAKERWMQVLEGSYLRDLLDRHGGNVSAASKAAGIDRKTFHRLISKYQLK